VIPINRVRMKSSVKHGRSDRDLLLTRFEALRLGPDGDLCAGYDKIILLDADVLPIQGYDVLFGLETPAGIIMEDRVGSYSDYNEISGQWSWHDLYNPICPHGTRIPSCLTGRVREDPLNMGVNAGLWVLGPSMKEYAAVFDSLDDPEIMGHVKAFPWQEMQLATILWSGRWTNVDIRYCSIGGYPKPDLLYGMHFAGLKPWQINKRSIGHYAYYPDFKLWYGCYTAMYWSHGELRRYPVLKRLWEFCKGIR